MQFFSMVLASGLSMVLSTSLVAPTPLPTSGGQSPPGMVLQEGGRTKIGSDIKTITSLLEDHIEAREKASSVLSEVPEHTQKVDDCFLMLTEVTNEQYHQYVTNANAQPPYLWAAEALEAARQEYFDAFGEKVKKAKAEGRPRPKSEQFDSQYWWNQNWKGKPWKMPADIATKPVVYVDYQDARGYAEWAGLRLQTEFEFERAVRKNTNHNFPWGNEWRQGVASTKEMRRSSEISDVGTFPDGANGQGVMDLVGNVWEWTSSKFVEYPGWKHRAIKIGRGGNKKEINSMPKWSADRRVIRSGSQSTSWIFARASTRGGFDRYQRASVLGFRCAASPKVGFDFASERLRSIPNEIRPTNSRGPVVYDPGQVIAMDRWTSEPGSAKVPGYAVISGYDYVLFTPAKSMQTNGVNDIRQGSALNELFHVGFLSSNHDMLEPVLAAGTYLVAMRGAGDYPKLAKPAADEEEEEAEAALPKEREGGSFIRIDEFLEIDTSEDNFIFLDMSGTPVAAIAASKVEYGSPKAGAAGLKVLDRSKTIEVEVPGEEGEESEVEKVVIVEQWLDVVMFIKGKSRKGLKTTLSVRFEKGLLDGDWRK